MTRTGLTAGLLLGLALTLAGCKPPPPPPPEPPPLVKKTAPEEAGDSASATGKLILVRGCFALEGSDRSLNFLLWPAEARAERLAGGAVRVLGTPGKAQKTVQVGQQIVVGGSALGTMADTALVGPGRPIEATAAFQDGCVGSVWNVYSFEPDTGAGSAMLQGKWVVHRLNGAPLGPKDHLTRITIDGGRFRAQSECAAYWWTYTASAGAFRAREEPYAGPACTRARTLYEQAFEEAIDRAISVEKDEDGFTIRGPGGQVVLRRE